MTDINEMVKKKHAFLFDLDGTLINTLPDIVGVVNRVRLEFGLPARPTLDIAIHVGKGAESLVSGAFPELKGKLSHADLIQAFRSRYFVEPHHGGYLYEGVTSTLGRLKELSYLVGIATNKPEKAAHVTLKYYLPEFRFDIIACPENVSEKKPSPLHLLEPLGQLGVSPEFATFVGDDEVDFLSADGAGVRFLGISFGIGNVKAPIMLDKFSKLLDYLPLN